MILFYFVSKYSNNTHGTCETSQISGPFNWTPCSFPSMGDFIGNTNLSGHDQADIDPSDMVTTGLKSDRGRSGAAAGHRDIVCDGAVDEQNIRIIKIIPPTITTSTSQIAPLTLSLMTMYRSLLHWLCFQYFVSQYFQQIEDSS